MAKKRAISAPVLTGLLRFLDVAGVALAGVITYYARFHHLKFDEGAGLVVIVVTLVSANVFHYFRLYELPTLLTDPYQARRLFMAAATTASITLILAYLTKASTDHSRIWLSLWALTAVGLLLLIRLLLRMRLSRWQAKGQLTRRMALVGAGPQGQRLVEHLAAMDDQRVSLVGIYDDRASRIPATIVDHSIKGTVDDLLATISREHIDEVIVALPWSAESRLAEIMAKLRTAPVDVRLCPEGVAFQFSDRAYSEVRGVGMLNIYDRPMSHWASVIKGIEDRTLAVLLLIFVSPLMAAIAIAIKLDSRGPIIFRQRRYGFNNELIEVYKFRTLHPDRADADAEKLVTAHDDRVTRVGAMLRRSNLDELPQFVNVLKGEMSIVGPRAHAVKAKAAGQLYQEVVAEYFARHRVKPGITGWAQVNGYHGETDTREKIELRVKYDLDYIEKWSLWLDLKIILMTPFTMLFSKNH
jgi:Undecaprenyl-phosphate glucose phosphotransferase